MTQWEYKVFAPVNQMGAREIENKLNEFGREGWELIHAAPGLHNLVLKRERPDEEVGKNAAKADGAKKSPVAAGK